MSNRDGTQVRSTGWDNAIFWGAVILFAAALCWSIKGVESVELSLAQFVDQLLLLLPRMSASLLISGFIQVLVPREVVTRWLGEGAGVKGFFAAAAVGALTPGGPMLAFPLVVVLRNSGASTVALITFLTAWATLGFHRILMFELPLMGEDFALVRYVSSLPLALVAGVIAWLWLRFTGKRKGEHQ